MKLTAKPNKDGYFLRHGLVCHDAVHRTPTYDPSVDGSVKEMAIPEWKGPFRYVDAATGKMMQCDEEGNTKEIFFANDIGECKRYIVDEYGNKTELSADSELTEE